MQLLEPERYPYLYKALYGILMLLPQSTAFTTLRARLGSVSNLGFLHAVPRACVLAPLQRTHTDDWEQIVHQPDPGTATEDRRHPMARAAGSFPFSPDEARTSSSTKRSRWFDQRSHRLWLFQRRVRWGVALGDPGGEEEAAGSGEREEHAGKVVGFGGRGRREDVPRRGFKGRQATERPAVIIRALARE